MADLSPTDAWAVGEALGGATIVPFVEHWDGSQWQQVPFQGIGLGKLTAVSASGPDDVWMVGTRNDNVFQHPRPFVAHWDGTRVRVVRTARLTGARSVELTNVTALAPDDVWAVGARGRHGQTYLPLVEHYDGTSWSVVAGDPAQGRDGNLTGVDGSSADDAWSVGWYAHEGDPSFSAYAQHWDGTQWTQSVVPTPGYASFLTSVSVVAKDDVLATGYWLKSRRVSTNRPLLAHWDGATWSFVGVPNGPHAATTIESVSMVSATDGFAVGETTSAAHTTPYAIHRNGEAWSR